MGKRSRTKGKRFEREVVNRLRVYWPNVRRGWWQAKGGAVVPDVEGSPYWLEVTHGQQPPIQAKMRQALGYVGLPGGPAYRTPVVISKRDHDDPLVTMRLDDWILLAVTKPDVPE